MEQNKTGKYLKYAIGEIVLVVIGILIALSINNWNDHRKSQSQESLYLKRLIAENKQDINTFNRDISLLEKGVEIIEKLSSALNTFDTTDQELIKAASDFISYGGIYPAFSSSTTTFDDLSSTGNLKYIRNSELRNELVQHYAKHKKIAEWMKISNEWAIPIDAPFNYNNSLMRFDASSAFLFGEQDQAKLADHLRDKKDEYINNAAIHFWVNKGAIRNLNYLIDETSELIDHFELELKE